MVDLRKLIGKGQNNYGFSGRARIFVFGYLTLVIVGLFLGFIGFFIPALNSCMFIFGHTVCSPIGEFIVLFASFPGYFLSAILLAPFPKVPEFISVSLVGFVSLLFYYVLGKLASTSHKSKVSLRNVIFWIAVGGFVILMLLFFYLMLAVRK